MFEHVPDYPMAVTAASGADATAVRLAVKWLLQTTDAVWWPAAGVRPESAEHPRVANLGGVGRPSSRHDLESWPSKPTTTTPAAFDRVVSDAMRALSNTVVELAALRVGRKL
jgi:hypothetical protein